MKQNNPAKPAATKTIKLDYLARVEGEGALHLKIQGDRVEHVQLKIFEPPRFFEAFLRGRSFDEAPDVTSRICGICPVAYQMSAVHAMEDAVGVRITGPLRELRRLLYCGEWIESHSLHIYMLHAPDFLGFEDAIAMAKQHQAVVLRGLRLKKAGNTLMTVLGGREIHPINVRLGGFYKAPSKAELLALRPVLEQAAEDAAATVEWVAGFDFPAIDVDCELVALRHDDEYPLNEGRVVSTGGIDLAARDYEGTFEERHAPYSNALQSVVKGRGTYLTGPMARLALNFDKLPAEIQLTARAAGIDASSRNPFKMVISRAVEVLYAVREALRIIDSYTVPDASHVDVAPRAGMGFSCTEAPRGLLYHRYQIDAQGIIQDAKIVPPTSQNQLAIEDDLRRLVTLNVKKSESTLGRLCERAIRNYDPCISCATHFLKLTIDRGAT